MSQALSNSLPYWRFDEQIMVYDDLSFGVGFKLIGVDYSLRTDEELNELSSKLKVFLNSLPESYKIQIQYQNKSDIQGLLATHFKSSLIENKNEKVIIEERRKFINTFNQRGILKKNELNIFLRSKPTSFRKKGFFEKSKRYTSIEEKAYFKERKSFERAIDSFELNLQSLGLSPRRMSQDNWSSKIYEYLNKKRSKSLRPPKINDLSEDLALTDISISKDYLESDDLKFTFVNLKTLPDSQTFISMIDRFTDLPFEYLLNMNISIDIQKNEIDKIKLKRK